MIGKKINQLATELSPLATDLTIIGDPTTGVSKKITLEQISSLFGGSVSFYTNLASFPAVGNIDIIYCAKDTNKLYLWSGSAYTEVFPSQALLDTYQLRSEKGNANGYASLDSLGKVPISQLPSSLMEYKGTWNAATNTPTLANGTGDTGDVYICNVAGTVNFGAGPLTFAVGDYVIYSGSIWQRSSGAVGTVTSVAVSRSGDALAITGSPITTSGTINLGFAGNSTQYINGAGNLVTFPGIINEAQNLITEVYNKTGATLTKGTIVYINGGQGNLPSVTKALATGDSTSAQTYGIVRNDITNNNNGYVVVAGRISDLDTQAYTEGTQLYLSPTTAGTFTSTKPYAPNHLVYVGIVVRAHPTQGVVEVKIQNGYEMDELHNVAAQSPDNNDILQYKTATSLWTKVAGTTSNIAEGSNLYYTDARSRAALSFTAGSGAYNSTTGVITIPTNTNQLTNGASFITLGSLSASSPLSYNSGTGAFSISQANSTTNGFLSSTDWNTFNSKQSALTFSSPLVNTAGTISIPAASGSVNGYLSSTDWTTFNSKQNALSGTGFVKISGTTISYDNSTYYLASNPNAYIALTNLSAGAGISYNNTTGVIASTITQYTDAMARAAISLTTTGTSGAATYNSTTGVLNVPQYAPDLSGYVPTSRTLTINGTAYDLSANRSWSVGTVTSVGLSSATSGVTIGSTPITTSGTITLAIATASGSQQGLLSSTDWTTFNNKQNALTNPVTGTGTTNYLPKFTGTSTIGNSAIYENGTNVGINTASPSSYTNLTTLTINGTNGSVIDLKTGNTLYGEIYSLTNELRIDAVGASSVLKFLTNSATRMTLNASGNLGLGVTPSAWLNTLNALQIGAAHLFGQTTGTGTVSLGNNVYLNSTPAYIYQYNGKATRYSQYDGQHEFYTAPSGTAGNAISFTQAMTLASTGNLLVGTTTDSGYKMEVAGSTRISSSGGVELSLRSASSNPQYISFSEAGVADRWVFGVAGGSGDLQFRSGATNISNGTEILRIASSGAATFSSSVTANARSFIKGSAGYLFDVEEQSSNKARFQSYVASNEVALIAGYDTTAVPMTFYAGGSERMRITSDGNVGIGTTSPSGALHVATFGQYSYFASNANGAYPANVQGISFGWNASAGGGETIIAYNKGAGSTGGLVFANNDGGSYAERMRITSGGQLKFNTYTSSSAWTGTAVANLAVDSSGNVITVTSGGGGGISGSGAANQLTYWDSTSSVTGSATLTYSPTSSLAVSPTITASSGLARAVNITTTLTASAAADQLIALDINPTFTNGANANVTNAAIRINGALYIGQGKNSASNIIVGGVSSGRNINSGVSNISIGSGAASGLTNGSNNVFIGGSIGGNISTTSNNTAIGHQAMQSSSGSSNVAIGQQALNNGTNGSLNTAVGSLSLSSAGAASNNVALGFQAGRYAGSGTGTNNTTSANSLYIGYDTRPSANANSNEVVIAAYNGTAGAIGLGTNTTSIGNSSTTGTFLYGRTILGSTTDNGSDRLQVSGNAILTGSIKTGAPSSGSAHAWKLGSYAAGGTGTATGVIYIEVNGQIYSIPALLGTP